MVELTVVTVQKKFDIEKMEEKMKGSPADQSKDIAIYVRINGRVRQTNVNWPVSCSVKMTRVSECTGVFMPN